MTRRRNTTGPSTVNWQIRVTRDEDDRAKALADYENSAMGKVAESFSDMVRRLINAERRRFQDAGFRPPLKPKRQGTDGGSDVNGD